jgi:hypothetical protein
MRHFTDALFEDLLEDTEELYFLSPDNMDGKTLSPRVPDNFLIKNGYEDSETPRVCFAKSIDGALMALSQNLKGKELYVHQPVDPDFDNIVEPSIEQVPDVELTTEVWYTDDIEVKTVGKILVKEDDGLPGHKYTYGDNEAELYGWNWRWLRATPEELQEIADKIKAEVDAHEEDGPYGNQNCMLCTWAVELQLRGEDFLPRPVISEDDIIFEKGHYNFIKGGKKEKFSSVEELLTLIENGGRYYCHVNWADSEGGHEFLLADDGDRTYIVDGQAGKVVPVAEDKEYFKDINFENSYIVRVDDKELDQEVLNLNDLEQMSKSALESEAE